MYKTKMREVKSEEMNNIVWFAWKSQKMPYLFMMDPLGTNVVVLTVATISTLVVSPVRFAELLSFLMC